jgi:hypothetical protein
MTDGNAPVALAFLRPTGYAKAYGFAQAVVDSVAA